MNTHNEQLAQMRNDIERQSEQDGRPVPRAMLMGLSKSELSAILKAPADERMEVTRQYTRAKFGGAADEFGEGGSVDAEFKFGGKVDKFFPFERFWENAKVKKQPEGRWLTHEAWAFAYLSEKQLALIKQAFQDMLGLEVNVSMNWTGSGENDYTPTVDIKLVNSEEKRRLQYRAAYAGLRAMLIELTSFVPQVYGFKAIFSPKVQIQVIQLYLYQADVWRPMQAAITSKKKLDWLDMLDMKKRLREQMLSWGDKNYRGLNPYREAIAELFEQRFRNEWQVSPSTREYYEKREARRKKLHAPAFALGGEIFSGDSPYFWMK